MALKTDTYERLSNQLDVQLNKLENPTAETDIVQTTQVVSMLTNSAVRIAESEDSSFTSLEVYNDILAKKIELEDSVQAKIDETDSLLASVTGNPALTYTADAIDKQNKLQNQAEFKRSGYTKEVSREDRWLETNTPNVIVDKVSEPIVIDGVVYDRLGEGVINSYSGFVQTEDGWTIDNDNGIFTCDGIDSLEYLYTSTNTAIKNNKSYEVLVTISEYVSGELFVSTTTGNKDSDDIGNKNGVSRFVTNPVNNTNGRLYFRSEYFKGTISNISVRELQSLELPEAPFATGSTDELITDGGITTASSHSKGDIVVTGKELVTNGTFDSDISGWSGDGVTHNIDKAVVTDTSGTFKGRAWQLINTEIGKEYVLSADIQNVDMGVYASVQVRENTSGGVWVAEVGNLDTVLKNITTTFIATTSVTAINILVDTTSTSSKTAYFDNISVTLKDKTYRATDNTVVGEVLREAVYQDDVDYVAGTKVQVGLSIYQAKIAVPQATDNTAYPVTNTTYWDYIGESKFEPIDFVTRQDVFYSTPTGYGSFKGYKDFTATELNEGGSDLIASRYSDRFSKISENCYLLDGTTKVTNLQVSGSRLNAGAYHPIFNSGGTATWHNAGVAHNDSWNDTNPSYLYQSFIDGHIIDTIGVEPNSGSLGKLSGHPQNKFYDVIYLKGENGLAPHSLFYAKDDYVLPRDTFGLMSGSATYESRDYLSGKFLYFTNNTINGTHEFGVRSDYIYDNISKFIGDTVYAYNETQNKYFKGIVNGAVYLDEGRKHIACSNVWTDYAGATGYISGDGYYLFTLKHPQLLTYAEKLTTDCIGDPDNYPSEWKSYLAGGGVTSVNPLLVGQDGTDYSDDLTNFNTMIFSDKILEGNITVIRAYQGGEYGTFNMDVNNVKNSSDTSAYVGIGGHAIVPYTSYNTPYTQLDPQKITKVTPKSIATNSHSIYQDALITWMATGKIPTGS